MFWTQAWRSRAPLLGGLRAWRRPHPGRLSSFLRVLSTAWGLVAWVGAPLWGLVLAHWPGLWELPEGGCVQGLWGELTELPEKPWSQRTEPEACVPLCATALSSHRARSVPQETRGGAPAVCSQHRAAPWEGGLSSAGLSAHPELRSPLCLGLGPGSWPLSLWLVRP